ncbi:MAG: peptide ABC transporter permease, partial [Nitrospirota bacterium]
MFSHLKKNKIAFISAIIIAALVLIAIIAPIIAPYDPLRINLDALRLPPTYLHWMGTDNKGRDVFSRVIYGARVSLLVGVLAAALSMVIGVLIGITGGYVGGKIDAALSALTDMVMAFPSLL